ncbi:MAG TPA: tRNA cyclic N6-threonylcarbamoyladenosine(37) synthase TcdA [Herbaspirillum sp.]|jgi:tRNA A37 threonylcarbamoyladenosine dehydratase
MNSPNLSPQSSIDATSAEIDFDRRFGGIARLYGASALRRFRQAHVCVIGVGGVGSWVVEALARSAIGKITMIDLDNLAESNVNRQIHALSDTLGKAKVTALAERIALINPFCVVTEIEDFLTPDNMEQMIGGRGYDYVVDAIDNVQAKVALIAYCRDHALPLLTVGSAGGQIDPTKIEVRDLSKTEQEPLLAKVRKRLRTYHRFPRGDRNRFGVDAVFSTEPVRLPEPADGASCDIDGNPITPSDDGITGLNCAGYGSAVVVTASFGLVAAAHVLHKLAGGSQN